MLQISLDKAAEKFSSLVEASLKGEEVIITRDGHPILKLVKVNGQKPQPRFGSGQHLNIQMSEDFDEPLEDFAEYM